METNLTNYQIVFMAFYAIFWGATFNVQGRWKAFQYPLIHHWRISLRVILSITFLNILPILYFYVILKETSLDINAIHNFQLIKSCVFLGIVPAFGIFGFYRIWLGIVEIVPDCFYFHSGNLPVQIKHVDPYYRLNVNKANNNDQPFVFLNGIGSGLVNFFVGLLYISLGYFVPCCFISQII